MLLDSVTLQTKSGEKVAAEAILNQAKVVLLYFSAHWCPPCRKFTPVLREFYEEVNEDENKQVEIIFVSADKSAEEFQKYFSDSHGDWLSVPFEAEELREQLRQEFGKKLNIEGELIRSGIPCLVVLSGSDFSKVITYDGVSDVSTMGSMALDMKWRS